MIRLTFLLLGGGCLIPMAIFAAEPIVIAHRGASGYVPEHTLESKVLAHAMQADFIEQDIVLSKDRIPIVLHDVHVDTVSDVAEKFPDRHRNDGRFYAIDFTLAELKQLRVVERFHATTNKQVFPNRFSKGQSRFEIATLEEELQLIQQLNRTRNCNTGIYPEIKQPAWHREQGHDISAMVLDVLRKYGYRSKSDACWLQCFEYDEVSRIRKDLGWNGRMVLLLGSFENESQTIDMPDLRTDEGLRRVAETVDGIGPSIALIITGSSADNRQLSSLVERSHALGLQVHPYTMRIDELPKTVRTSNELMELLFNQAKVDGLFTDFPDVTVRWLAAR